MEIFHGDLSHYMIMRLIAVFFLFKMYHKQIFCKLLIILWAWERTNMVALCKFNLLLSWQSKTMTLSRILILLSLLIVCLLVELSVLVRLDSCLCLLGQQALKLNLFLYPFLLVPLGFFLSFLWDFWHQNCHRYYPLQGNINYYSQIPTPACFPPCYYGNSYINIHTYIKVN